jgi:hypothetical protein
MADFKASAFAVSVFGDSQTIYAASEVGPPKEAEYRQEMSDIWSKYSCVGKTVELSMNSLEFMVEESEQGKRATSEGDRRSITTEDAGKNVADGDDNMSVTSEDDPQSTVDKLWEGLDRQHALLRGVHDIQEHHLDISLAKESILRQFMWLFDWAVRERQTMSPRSISEVWEGELVQLRTFAANPITEQATSELMRRYLVAVQYLSHKWEVHTRNSIRHGVSVLNGSEKPSCSSAISIPGEDNQGEDGWDV